MSVSERAFVQLALEEPNQWELVCGELRRRPGMTYEHNRLARQLFLELVRQLNPEQFEVSLGMGHVRRSAQSYFIPDVYVIPKELTLPLRGKPDALEVYDAPLPLVVEVWSPSTGDYDLGTKIPEYQARGDWEIWRLHPYERTLRAWRRQADGSYAEGWFTGGVVHPVALPGVAIDLDALFG